MASEFFPPPPSASLVSRFHSNPRATPSAKPTESPTSHLGREDCIFRPLPASGNGRLLASDLETPGGLQRPARRFGALVSEDLLDGVRFARIVDPGNVDAESRIFGFHRISGRGAETGNAVVAAPVGSAAESEGGCSEPFEARLKGGLADLKRHRIGSKAGCSERQWVLTRGERPRAVRRTDRQGRGVDVQVLLVVVEENDLRAGPVADLDRGAKLHGRRGGVALFFAGANCLDLHDAADLHAVEPGVFPGGQTRNPAILLDDRPVLRRDSLFQIAHALLHPGEALLEGVLRHGGEDYRSDGRRDQGSKFHR